MPRDKLERYSTVVRRRAVTSQDGFPGASRGLANLTQEVVDADTNRQVAVGQRSLVTGEPPGLEEVAVVSSWVRI